jgi:antitoxin MazE
VEAHIRKWGNSLGLRIPKPFAEEAGMTAGSTVELSMEDGNLVVRPRRAPSFTLEALLGGITRANRHEAIDFGQRVGREVW